MPISGEPHHPPLRAPWLRAAGLAAALAVGWSADVTADGATWFGVRGPQCPLGACLGPFACPGCGLLRSTAAALQGDLSLAVATHPAGLVVAALLLGAALLHFDVLRRGRELPAHRSWRRAGHLAFVAAVLLGWLARPLLS